MADQLEGDPNRFPAYRAAICDFIEQHKEDFEPFIEDDQPFDKVSVLDLHLAFENCVYIIYIVPR
jgi:OTU domain-containing protein 3